MSVLTNKAQNIESISTLLATMFTKDRYEVKALSESHVLFLNSVYIAENRTDITGFGYAQLLLPEYFANHKKILFLEPDQIVKGDLTPLWKQVILNDIKIGAVEYTQGKNTLITLSTIFPSRKINVYNAGVMIIDAETWIHSNYTQLCFDAVEIQKKVR